jgi:hypothetical protein
MPSSGDNNIVNLTLTTEKALQNGQNSVAGMDAAPSLLQDRDGNGRARK